MLRLTERSLKAIILVVKMLNTIVRAWWRSIEAGEHDGEELTQPRSVEIHGDTVKEITAR
jgi:hypothetical protein